MKHTKILKGLKVLFWVLLAVVLLCVGLLTAAVKVLSPERLTPIATEAANRMLNADVSVQRVALSIRKSFPFLTLDVDSLVLCSRDIRSLPVSQRDTLPVWADTLLSVDHLHGGINLLKLSHGVIDLNDLEIVRPKVNILVINDTLNNFAILPPKAVEDTTAKSIPDIRLNRFSLKSPLPISYADVAHGTRITAHIHSAQLTHNPDPAERYLPIYSINFDSEIASPLLAVIGQRYLPFGFNGEVEWHHDHPYHLILKDFDFKVSEISGTINTVVDFDQQLTVESLDFNVDPLSVSRFLAMVPDSIAKKYYIPKDIDTNAEVRLNGALEQPYILGSASMPFAHVQLHIPPCNLKYDKLDLRVLEVDTHLLLAGGTPNDAKLDIKLLRLAGPATSLRIKGALTDMLADPLFDGEVKGNTDMDLLPEIVTRNIPATLKGRVTADASVKLRPSMFRRATFHKLHLDGDVKVDDFLYLADDTLTMYYVHHTDLHFGTNDRIARRDGNITDSLLRAKVYVDSAALLVSGLNIKVNSLDLGVGAQNRNPGSDTTWVVPMAGSLRVRNFSLFSISDSAGLRVRDINGHVSMQRYLNDAHLPLFRLNLGLGHISAGDNRTRFMVKEGKLKASLGRLPETALSKPRREVRHIADSLHRVHPHIPVDSVYIMALEIRKRNSRPGHHRVHAEITDQEGEIIDWGTSSALKKLLLDWNIEGSLMASTARLFTSSFPVRNRVENLNVAFTNDSIALANVKYKAGNSDFLISGNITNVKRAFTSKRAPNSLRIHFDMLSEWIDVNEISHAFFTGSTHSKTKIGDADADESMLDETISKSMAEDKTRAPLLIPTNIDAELSVRANAVAYSDLVLNNFKGTVLMYDGALSLHDLTAASEVGTIDLNALYSAPSKKKIDFGFGMKLDDFNIENFIKLVPAVDSMMPVLRDLSGIINANLALTTEVNENMDLVLPSIKAAINITGDSLSLIDPATFKKVAKWLRFKDRDRNMINHISAELIVDDGEIRLFPFVFDFDRYRLGVQGYNDFNKNLNFHIAVLRSPIPFKFGINISGSYNKPKIRFGGAKFDEKTPAERAPIVNATRINLINQFQNVFKRGVRNSKFAALDISDKPLAQDVDLGTDTLSSADSLLFRSQGLIPPD